MAISSYRRATQARHLTSGGADVDNASGCCFRWGSIWSATAGTLRRYHPITGALLQSVTMTGGSALDIEAMAHRGGNSMAMMAEATGDIYYLDITDADSAKDYAAATIVRNYAGTLETAHTDILDNVIVTIVNNQISNGDAIRFMPGTGDMVMDNIAAYATVYARKIDISGTLEIADAGTLPAKLYVTRLDDDTFELYQDVGLTDKLQLDNTGTGSLRIIKASGATPLDIAAAGFDGTTDVVTKTAHGLVTNDVVYLADESSFEVCSDSGLTTAVDLSYTRTSGTVFVGGIYTDNFEAMAYDPVGAKYYVAKQQSPRIYVIDPAAPTTATEWTNSTFFSGVTANVYVSDMHYIPATDTMLVLFKSSTTAIVVEVSDWTGTPAIASSLSLTATIPGAEGITSTGDGSYVFINSDSTPNCWVYTDAAKRYWDIEAVFDIRPKWYFRLNESSFADTVVIANAMDHTNHCAMDVDGTAAASALASSPLSWSTDTVMNITTNTGTNDLAASGATGPSNTATTAISIACWFNTTQAPAAAAAIAGFSSGDSGVERTFIGMVNVSSAIHPIFSYQTGASSPLKERYATSITPNDGKHHHLTGTLDLSTVDTDSTGTTGKMLLYYDGTLRAATHDSGDNDAVAYDSNWGSPSVRIGSTETGGALASEYVGAVSRVLIHDGLITAAQVRALYEAGPPVVGGRGRRNRR